MNIVSKVSGGLGNQLFQYAIGRRIALDHTRPLVLDLHWYHDIPAGSTPREELLSRLNIVASFANSHGDPAALAALAPAAQRHWTSWWRSPLRVVKERAAFRYDERPLRPPARNQTLYLDGYWQSYRYFEPVREVLVGEIAPRDPLPDVYRDIAARIRASNSVMLHVRRGDYVHSASAAAVLGALPLDYYARALQWLKSRVDAPVMFVFSDDLDWAREHLDTGCDTVYVAGDASAYDVVHELSLMSQCKHQIIANSSLSWWAAWLNTNVGKLVAAPARWLADQPVPLDDLIPAGWHLVPQR
jgi:hypothetical protein